METHMLAASDAAERGRTDERTCCLAGRMLNLRVRLITGPSNHNYGFTRGKTRRLSLGSDSAFLSSFLHPAWQGGRQTWNQDGEPVGMVDMEPLRARLSWRWNRSFNNYSFQSPPNQVVSWRETQTKRTKRRLPSNDTPDNLLKSHLEPRPGPPVYNNEQYEHVGLCWSY
ncbi:hypothetical protein MGYG_05565 [Nannizzia gypsea CBS 118893]|uniref:Uncharacterized protein n=1 Tax=Arthroderma gypseum (strain ATCC MYA-4604 / CBS 118893) TaxID=535722 RepID=E4UWM6_ARTGP|nr:hypothetical protein MGYG_05565 [Nannizzia gypsea CBS 118893]EFR02569.1 hypothetical protein MGYG_05565 [Nannizzia gypsea CBS 118893]